MNSTNFSSLFNPYMLDSSLFAVNL